MMPSHLLKPALLSVTMIVLILVACSGASSPRSAVTGVGFLPIPTRTPAPTELNPLSHERSDLCRGFLREVCVVAGDRVNIYEAYALDRVVALWTFENGEQRWILDADRVQALLRHFDREVVLEPREQIYSFTLVVQWPRGEGLRLYGGTLDSIDLVVDQTNGLVGLSLPAQSVQWSVPADFADQVRASFSDVTPTPLPLPPQPTRAPTPTITPTIVPPGAVFFQHPEERLVWDGPDDRVVSDQHGHCERPELREDFGIPGYVAVNEQGGFWPSRAVEPSDSWRWTGYFWRDWFIWQGDDPSIIYLLNVDEPQVAFEYRSFLCF